MYIYKKKQPKEHIPTDMTGDPTVNYMVYGLPIAPGDVAFATCRIRSVCAVLFIIIIYIII